MISEKTIRTCAKEYDSFYLYEEAKILECTQALKDNFPDVEFLYSVKCNPHPQVLRCVFGQGFGADAASAAEVRMGQEGGLKPNQIFYSAPGKSLEDLKYSIPRSTLIADSLAEVARIQAVAEELNENLHIGLRINPNFTLTGEGGAPAKFGIDEDDAIALAKSNPYKNLKITGIHVHLRSQLLEPELLKHFYGNMFRLAEKFAKICGPLEYVNLGSGIGIPYAPDDRNLDLAELGQAEAASSKEFRAKYPNTRIFIEVGRYAVGKSGIYVTKVMDRKVSHGKTFVLLKNTLNGFIRPSVAFMVEQYSPDAKPAGAEPLYTSKDAFRYIPLNRSKPEETVTLVGNLCTGTDIIADNITLPKLEHGDLLMITNAGAYAAVLSPMQFSTQVKPKEIFITSDDGIIAK